MESKEKLKGALFLPKIQLKSRLQKISGIPVFTLYRKILTPTLPFSLTSLYIFNLYSACQIIYFLSLPMINKKNFDGIAFFPFVNVHVMVIMKK